MYSAAALFHTSALVTLSIGFAPMIVVLGIVVDWQAHLERWAPKWLHRLIHPSWCWAAALGGLVAVLSGMSVWLLTAHARAAAWLDFVPNQERVWFAVAPFALLAGGGGSRLCGSSGRCRADSGRQPWAGAHTNDTTTRGHLG